MQHNSRPVSSNQAGIYDKLTQVVQKHLVMDYKKPIQTHNQMAFENIVNQIDACDYRGLILDSCCGTGQSSVHWAATYPEHLIIGIDQSYTRLNKHREQPLPDNLLLLRANCEDIWRLCQQHNLYFDKHFIFYPNPWPKANHFKRRWHGHPVFPVLKSLSGELWLRSNWVVYLQEFALAWELLSGHRFAVNELVGVEPVTLFERKYLASQHGLFELIIKNK